MLGRPSFAESDMEAFKTEINLTEYAAVSDK